MDTGYVPPPLHTFDPDGFVFPPVRVDQWAFTVAVCGGLQYTEADGRFVRGTVHRLIANEVRTHNVHLHLAPAPGAARIIYDWFGDRYKCQMGWYGRSIWGRAADFRAAAELMAVADTLIAFEPLDLIARYPLKLAALTPDRDGREGRGVKVAVIRKPAGA